jgi:citrate lyase beta subunit
MICVPKADAQSVSLVIGAIEALARVPRVWALVESATGLRDLDRICSTPGMERLALGEVDPCAELGL